jgi:hypothetical protein
MKINKETMNEKIRVMGALQEIMTNTLPKLVAITDNSKLNPNEGKKTIEIVVELFLQSIKKINLRYNIK